MATQLIQDERIKKLNDKPPRDGKYVLYWMQQSQRAQFNHALEYAIRTANDRGDRLLVAFGLMDDYPEANLRHYRFMLEGLQDVAQELEQRGIPFVLQRGAPADVAVELAQDASVVVCDRGYLRHQRAWRKQVAEETDCEVWQVEADVVVPIEIASDKAEYAARTIRPKLKKHREKFLVELKTNPLKKDSLNLGVAGEDLSDLDALLSRMKLDTSVAALTKFFRGGTSRAKSILRKFRDKRLTDYDENRNQPQTNYVSHMSKYLHFGQISPVDVALTIFDARNHPEADRDSFLEELLCRRELAMNFVYYNPNYDSYNCIPDWAQKTLDEHKDDPREHVYSQKELEAAETHDPYWNACMKEMRYTGYMHNYMRMYWGKKILEWTNTPQTAHRFALAINNKYFLDGRDANSFTGVAWVFGVHDRPWKERPIFGKIRYMAASGLERKCDIDAYVEKVDDLVNRAESESSS